MLRGPVRAQVKVADAQCFGLVLEHLDGGELSALQTEVAELIRHYSAGNWRAYAPLAAPNAALAFLNVPKHRLKCL